MNIYAGMVHNYFTNQPATASPSGLSPERTPVAIVGARGYAGVELARLILKHPRAELKACFATDTSFQLADFLPEESARNVPVLPLNALVHSTRGMTVFLATPAEVSLDLAPKLLGVGTHVIDLSGAFRLENAADYRRWYGIAEYPAESLLRQSEFGLLPFAGPLASPQGSARLIANPGCYATSVLMALVPLLREGVVQADSLVIDSKSGTSGAGRKAAENLLFNEVDGECLPYRVGRHQHLPEIVQHVRKFSGVSIDPMFTTHLLPVRRGILSGIYARLAPAASAGGREAAIRAVARAYARAYADYPLVRWAEGESNLLSLRKVVGTARTHISYVVLGDKLYVFSLIDNLLKGAASQAVENLNRIMDAPVDTGLKELEGVL